MIRIITQKLINIIPLTTSHPDVIGAGEVVFWSRAPNAMPLRLGIETSYPECVLKMTPESAKDIANIYESTLQKIVEQNTKPQHITDKFPHNFLNIGVIASLFPNVKIIHTKRDPIDTCLSIFFQNFNNAHQYAFDLSSLGFHYKQYERIMRHWHEILPDRITDIKYENTTTDPEFWSRKLISHIGLEGDDACLTPHKLEHSVKTASHWQGGNQSIKPLCNALKTMNNVLESLISALKN